MPLIQHIDFQVPDFGELPSGPTPPVADVAMQQLPEAAAHPNPQGAPRVGLRATLSAGGIGQALTRPLDSIPSLLSTSAWINFTTLIGGHAQLIAIEAQSVGPVAAVAFHPDSQSLSLTAYQEPPAFMPLPQGPPWRHVRLLYANGLSGLSLDLGNNFIQFAQNTPPTPTHAVLGPATKDAGATGHIDFDHWRISDAILPQAPQSPPAQPAAHPDRWLVVYRQDSARSLAFALEYANRRGVPPWNLTALDAPATETISFSQYLALQAQLEDQLVLGQLSGHVSGVLLASDLPVFVDTDGQGALAPVASLLQTQDTDALTQPNPLHTHPLDQRPTAQQLAGGRFAASIETSTTGDVLAPLDAADRAANPLDPASPHRVYLDPHPADDTAANHAAETLQAFVASLDAQSLRLPLFSTAPLTPQTTGRPDRFDTIQNDAVHFGWELGGPAANPNPFAQPAGPRLLSVQLDPQPTGGASLRNPTPDHWLGVAQLAGYAAYTAAVSEYDPNQAPNPQRFFQALRNGWTLAEAWAVASPQLRTPLHFFGDPLLTIPFPKQGFDILGPATPATTEDQLAILAKLPADQTSFTSTNTGTPILLRAVDPEGRRERNRRILPAYPPIAPAWPNRDGWQPARQNNTLRCIALWPTPAAHRHVATVTLETDPTSAVTELPPPQTPNRHRRAVVFELEAPANAARFRLRIEHADSSAPPVYTPWSTAIQPAAAPAAPYAVIA